MSVPIESRTTICDFLLVNNTNLYPISHCFIADNRSNLRFRQGVRLFNILVRGEPLNSEPQNLASNLETSLCRLVQNAF